MVLGRFDHRRRQMDQYAEHTERLELRTSDPITDNDARRIRSALEDLSGAELVAIAGTDLTFDRDPSLASVRMIIQMIDNLGIPRWIPKREGRLARRLRKMAESNRKEFGNGRLDCCDLPKD